MYLSCSVRLAALVRATFLALLAVAGSACAGSAPEVPANNEFRPYSANADARADIARALADNPGRKRVLLTFGANWCSDSRALESHYRGPVLAPLLEREFQVVHVDIGMFHRNLELAKEYGNPIDKGIPSVVLLDAEGKTLFVNHGGLSSAETMKPAEIEAWFQRLAANGRPD